MISLLEALYNLVISYTLRRCSKHPKPNEKQRGKYWRNEKSTEETPGFPAACGGNVAIACIPLLRGGYDHPLQVSLDQFQYRLSSYHPPLTCPDPKDDFYLSVNCDWLRDTTLKPGHSVTGMLADMSDIVAERIATLMTDGSIEGREAARVRKLYQMFMDWDSRAQSTDFYLAHMK